MATVGFYVKEARGGEGFVSSLMPMLKTKISLPTIRRPVLDTGGIVIA